MLDLHRLRLLHELAHRGTLAAVAEALSYSPSAISQQLSKLQAEVGVPLLEPVGRGVRLTPQARILVAHAEAVLERLERAEAELAASTDGVSGTLVMAAFQSVALGWLPQVLSVLADRHAHLRLEIVVREPDVALPGLLAGDYDLVVDEAYPNQVTAADARLDRQPVAEDRLGLVVPERWGTVDSLLDLADTPWTTEPPGTPAHAWTLAHCRAAGFEPRMPFAFDDLTLRLRFVQAGHAAAVLPELAGARRAPGVHVLDLQGAPARELSTLVRAGTARNPGIVALREALASVAAAGQPPEIGS